MHNLLRFIKINQFLLLFILIEGVSITLLLQNNSFQAAKTVEFSTQYTSALYNYTNSLSGYLALKKTNDYLVEENAKLHELLKHNDYFIDSTLLRNKRFNYIAAKVINNSVKKRNNFISYFIIIHNSINSKTRHSSFIKIINFFFCKRDIMD